MAPADAATIRQALETAAHPGGGWPYAPGGAARLEPTAWALLAGADTTDATRHRRFLEQCRQPAGLLVDQPGLPANLGFNALAAIALLRKAPASEITPRLLDAMCRTAGVAVAQSPSFRQDNSLRGWPWVEETFSWVEPTAWAVLALRIAAAGGVAPSTAAARQAEAERLLIDRACDGGGWNYGNANALGKNLAPYVATTAIVLLALSHRRDTPPVAAGINYLQRAWPTEPSTMTLALTTCCLDAYALDAAPVRAALETRLPIALGLGHVHALAAALVALEPTRRHVLAA